MENKGKLYDASILAAAVGTSCDEVKLNSEEIKPIALVATVSEGINQIPYLLNLCHTLELCRIAVSAKYLHTLARMMTSGR